MGACTAFWHPGLIWIAGYGILACVLPGCNRSNPRPAVVSRASKSASIELTPVDRRAYDARVAKHLGKVVLVDFWATWCAPCVEQFGHTVELAERYHGQGLAVMSVSCDEPTELEPIRDVLRSKGAGMVENLVSQFGGSPQTMEAFEISSGALPAYKLYDRNGELRQTFELDLTAERHFTLEDIDAAVEKLLAE